MSDPTENVGTEAWVDAIIQAQIEGAWDRSDPDDPEDDEPEPTEMPWWFGDYETEPDLDDPQDDEERNDGPANEDDPSGSY